MSYCEVRYEHFKREDSTNSIIVTLFDDDQVTPIVPNSSHSWSAKVAKEEDEEKYVGEYPVQLRGNEIILTSDRLVRLPHGTYLMELWENNNGKITIYPSADFIQFTIHKNATDTMGHVDHTTDINKIIDDLHKAGQNIKLGTVTTGAPGSSVIIRQRLENGQNLLDFTIPRGNTGYKGDKGDPPTLRIGSVTKVAPGGTPTASVSGSNGSYSLNLGIPQGQQGTGFNVTRIPSGSNLNTLTSNGFYSSMGGNNFINIPNLYNKDSFTMLVYGDSNQGSQIIIDPVTGIMYTRAARDNWRTWHDWVEVGGITGTNALPNLFTSQTTPTFTVGNADSTQHLSAQRFSYVYNKECQPKSFVGIRPLKGDTIIQSCVIRTSDGATLDSRICYSFYNSASGHYTHHIVPATITPLGNNEYRLSASYQIAEDDFQLKLMDIHNFGLSTAPGNGSDSWIEIDSPFASLVQSGGVVTNLLQALNIDAKPGVTLTNGIGHRSVPAGNHPSYDDYRYNVTLFEPSTRYRLTFVAWGSGVIRSYIYPVAVLSEEGDSRDGQKSWTLNKVPTQYSYEFNSVEQLGDDPQKTLMFRIPDGDQTVDFYLDTNSVTLEKVERVIATNLTPTLQSQSSLITNGIGHRTVPAGNHPSYDDYRYNVTSFEPSTRYRLTFVAWGSGNISSHVYPGAAPGELGNGDGQKTWALNKVPTRYSYEFDSFSQLNGDPQKTLLFRIPASDQAVDFSLDTRSVVLEKVGRGS